MLSTAVVLLMATATAPNPQAQVLQFTSRYCGACQEMTPVVQQVEQRGYVIRKIDVQQNPELANQFQVAQVPCFLALQNGRVTDQIVGVASLDRLLKLCQATRVAQDTNPPALAASIPSSTVAAAPGPTLDAAADSAMAASVRLKIVDDTGHSYGTGTIVDVHGDEALVLTCGHIFRASGGKGRILCDLFPSPAPKEIEGKLICYDLRRDVGLISLRPGVPVKAAKVGGAGSRPREGDAVFSIGCNRGEDPTINRNRVIAVNRYHGPANLVVGGRPVDGRSGGGLFDADGVLIGVCNAADKEADEGLYAALGPIHAELDKAGLGFIYRQDAPAVASTTITPASAPPLSSPPALTPPPQSPAILASPLAGARAAASSGIEQISQASPSARSAGSPSLAPQSETELICIVRSQDEADTKSRVFVIDQPSADLVRQLSHELSRRGPHTPTQMHRSNSPTEEASSWEGDWRSTVQ